MTSAAGRVAVLALLAAVPGLASGDAQARGLRLRGVSHGVRAVAVPRAAAEAPAFVAVAQEAATASAAPNPATTGAVGRDPGTASEPLRPLGSVKASGEPARITKAAEPWCRTGRVAGTGTGFCLIN